jgi:hypothetical protein
MVEASKMVSPTIRAGVPRVDSSCGAYLNSGWSQLMSPLLSATLLCRHPDEKFSPNISEFFFYAEAGWADRPTVAASREVGLGGLRPQMKEDKELGVQRPKPAILGSNTRVENV